MINNPKSEIAIFILFLIPGIPKDTLVYLAGITPISALKFFSISIIARFPGLLGSAYIGSNLDKKKYAAVIIVSIIACTLFAVGLLAKDKIIDKLHKVVLKHSHE